MVIRKELRRVARARPSHNAHVSHKVTICGNLSSKRYGNSIRFIKEHIKVLGVCMGPGNGSGKRRYVAIALGIAGTLALVGCGGLSLLPYQSDVANTHFKTYAQLQAAYQAVKPGLTRASELGRIGFDSARSANVEVLSYLGIVERFMPRSSIKFDRLAAPVQSCIDARDHCMAYVYRPSRMEQETRGNALLKLVGFDHTTVSRGWSAEIVLLVRNGRVAYKAMVGNPDADGRKPLANKVPALLHTAIRNL